MIIKPGDKVIWDSRSGYDIGYLEGDSGAYYHYSVKLITGVFPGSTASIVQSDVKPYTEELVEELTKRYGYRKSF